MNQKTIQTQIESLEAKNISEWTDKDWHIRHVSNDMELVKELKELPKDTTIYTILRRVSSSGMTRIIDMFYVKDSKPVRIHFATTEVFPTRRKLHNNDFGYKVVGCGMDMWFDLVYGLSLLTTDGTDSYYFKQEWM